VFSEVPVNFQVIAFLMMAVLLGLLFWAKFYAPIARKRSDREGEIFEAFRAIKEGSKSIDEALIQKARDYFNDPTINSEKIKLMIQGQ